MPPPPPPPPPTRDNKVKQASQEFNRGNTVSSPVTSDPYVVNDLCISVTSDPYVVNDLCISVTSDPYVVNDSCISVTRDPYVVNDLCISVTRDPYVVNDFYILIRCAETNIKYLYFTSSRYREDICRKHTHFLARGWFSCIPLLQTHRSGPGKGGVFSNVRP